MSQKYLPDMVPMLSLLDTSVVGNISSRLGRDLPCNHWTVINIYAFGIAEDVCYGVCVTIPHDRLIIVVGLSQIQKPTDMVPMLSLLDKSLHYDKQSFSLFRDSLVKFIEV